MDYFPGEGVDDGTEVEGEGILVVVGRGAVVH